MSKLWVAILLTALLGAAEPSSKDQEDMQDVLRRYLKGVNDCDAAAVKSAITSDFVTRFSWTRALSGRLLPSPEVCSPGRVSFEVAALARFFRSATDSVVLSDAYFRTVGMAGGDQAGRLYVTFVKGSSGWRIFQLRFHPSRFERPFFAVEPAKGHDVPEADGWVTLFDGSSTDRFQAANGDSFPETWRVEQGTLRAIASGSGHSLRTKDTYGSFDLRFEWKAPPKGNSGVKYRLFYIAETPRGGSDGAGFEYQVVDDSGDPGAIRFPLERSGALYNQIAPSGAHIRLLGDYNESRIVVRGRHCEHWLNGAKVVEFEAESRPPESPILIQHHETDFWFRNIRIRRLD